MYSRTTVKKVTNKLQYSASQFSVNIHPHSFVVFVVFPFLIASSSQSPLFCAENLSSELHTDFHRKKKEKSF